MANPTIFTIDDESFATEVLASEQTVLIDFTAEWCGPCKRFAPIVAEFAAETAGAVKVGKLDIDAAPQTAVRYGIRGAPTVVVFRDGREIARHVGVTSKQRLRALVETEIEPTAATAR